MPAWDAELYLQFANERNQPSLDLIARLADLQPRRVVDLGCGPGNSAALLRRRWPDAAILGLDNSPAMIAAARKSDPAIRWELADAATWRSPEPFELVFSNAVLHWIPRHAEVVARWFELVAPGGALAIQLPAYHHGPLHQRVALEAADDPAWRDRMRSATTSLTVETPGFYYDQLAPIAARFAIWETEYRHVMDGPEAILKWVSGTGLRPFLECLPDESERRRFEAMLVDGYRRVFPAQTDGRILFPFRRLFIIARR